MKTLLNFDVFKLNKNQMNMISGGNSVYCGASDTYVKPGSEYTTAVLKNISVKKAQDAMDELYGEGTMVCEEEL